ncbi:MAG: CBU_0592 family membrane protein [Alcanivorax sp.]
MLDYNLPELAAICGSTIFLLSYVYINRKANATNDIVYIVMNMAAAVLMLYSLTQYWNIGVLINNASWIIISIYSLMKHYKVNKDKEKILDKTIT